MEVCATCFYVHMQDRNVNMLVRDLPCIQLEAVIEAQATKFPTCSLCSFILLLKENYEYVIWLMMYFSCALDKYCDSVIEWK